MVRDAFARGVKTKVRQQQCFRRCVSSSRENCLFVFVVVLAMTACGTLEMALARKGKDVNPRWYWRGQWIVFDEVGTFKARAQKSGWYWVENHYGTYTAWFIPGFRAGLFRRGS